MAKVRTHLVIEQEIDATRKECFDWLTNVKRIKLWDPRIAGIDAVELGCDEDDNQLVEIQLHFHRCGCLPGTRKTRKTEMTHNRSEYMMTWVNPVEANVNLEHNYSIEKINHKKCMLVDDLTVTGKISESASRRLAEEHRANMARFNTDLNNVRKILANPHLRKGVFGAGAVDAPSLSKI
eukprot:GFYU01001524.1.p1 GENE.GFYU01001524.1~~GFYU01001524.1.p1  ORF type:complete len:180 (-),score=14.38 GFYU01001524.1:140-679(-)